MSVVEKVENAPAERKANPIKSFITGGFGGICNVLSGHPLDTIKVSNYIDNTIEGNPYKLIFIYFRYACKPCLVQRRVSRPCIPAH